LLIALSILYIKYIYTNVHARTHYMYIQSTLKVPEWEILCNCISPIKKMALYYTLDNVKTCGTETLQLIILKILIKKKFITSVLETSITKIYKNGSFHLRFLCWCWQHFSMSSQDQINLNITIDFLKSLLLLFKTFFLINQYFLR